MGYNTGKKVQEAGLIIGGLGFIGFLGLIYLMIYGNMSGNLGFGQDSATFNNETIALGDAGATPTSASGLVNGALTNVVITNATGGETVPTSNYTVTGVVITANTGPYNGTNVNVSATVSYDEKGKVDTDNVINNVTTGYGTFFGFSNTFFTIAAVVLLVFMLMGLLALAYSIMKMQEGKKTNGFN